MESMKEARAIQSLDEMTVILKNELENIAEGFISVGYYLKKTRDDGLYREKYQSIFEYAQAVFGISRFTATRFMEINDKYSIGGYSPQIEEKYRGYGSSKLTEMLKLPEDIRENVPAEATVRDIREAKAIVRETESRYGDQMELCDIAQGEPGGGPAPGWLEELALSLFRKDCREKFKEFVIWLKSPQAGTGMAEDILALINPTKFKMARLKRANVMMREEGIRVMPYRNQGENREYTYIEFAEAFERVFFPGGMDGRNAEEAYRETYQEPLAPDPEKPEKPMNTESARKSREKKEPKEKMGARPQGKSPEKPINTESGGQSGEEGTPVQKKEPEMPEKPMDTECGKDSEEELPGQMELARDFREYCPEGAGYREEPGTPGGETGEPGEPGEPPSEEPEAAAGCPYKARLEHLKTLARPEYARYMAGEMAGFMRLSFQELMKEETWQEWLGELVDESGRTIEEG